MKSKSKFFDLETPDFTANSRNILNDLLNSAIKNGLDISEMIQNRKVPKDISNIINMTLINSKGKKRTNKIFLFFRNSPLLNSVKLFSFLSSRYNFL